MADIEVDGDVVVVALSAAERVEALHGDLRIPVASLDAVELVEDVVAGFHGLKAPGTALPGVVVVGTFYRDGRRTFIVGHRSERRGLRLALHGERYDEVVVGLTDPDGVARRIAAAGGPALG